MEKERLPNYTYLEKLSFSSFSFALSVLTSRSFCSRIARTARNCSISCKRLLRWYKRFRSELGLAVNVLKLQHTQLFWTEPSLIDHPQPIIRNTSVLMRKFTCFVSKALLKNSGQRWRPLKVTVRRNIVKESKILLFVLNTEIFASLRSTRARY